jgi:hypothetical protein
MKRFSLCISQLIEHRKRHHQQTHLMGNEKRLNNGHNNTASYSSAPKMNTRTVMNNTGLAECRMRFVRRSLEY